MKVKKNKFVADKVRKIMQEGKSMKQAVAIALSMWERKKKKEFGAGGAISDFGVQTTFSTDFVEDSTDVAELKDPSEEVLATSDPELDNPELTEEEIKALKKKKALSAAGKGAAVGASIGSAIPVVGTAVGAAAGALIGGLGSLLGNKGVEDPELIMAKNGVKVIKKNKTYENGGLFDKLRERRAERRLKKVPVTTASTEEVLSNLAQAGERGGSSAGYYDTRDKEIVMFTSPADKGYEDVKTHEEFHVTQHSPILSFLAGEGVLRVQNPDVRKATRKLIRSVDKWEKNNPGKSFIGELNVKDVSQTPTAMATGYMLGRLPEGLNFTGGVHEYEAITGSAKKMMDRMGINTNVSFDDLLNTLEGLGSDNDLRNQGITNLRHLRNFMRNENLTEKQKKLIMKTISSNRYQHGGKHDEKKEEDNTSATPDDDIYKLMALVKDSPAPQGTTYDESDDTMNMPQPRFVSSASERIKRQEFKESGGESDPDQAVSPAGAVGRFQIMPATQKDLEDRGFIPTGLDATDPEDNRRMRDAKIDAILRTSLVSNPPKPITEINKLARIYASYNYGEGNVRKALNKAAADGVDIYNDPRLWFEYLPEETRNYVNYILFDE